MSSPLRVAIIGYGLAGAVFHAPLVATTPGMQVAALVTSSPERQAQARRDFPAAAIFSQAEALWNEPTRYDLVVVAAPNRVHTTLGLAAMRAGLPVVIDKPLASSVAEAEQLLQVSHETGKMLSVFQNRRWDNDFLTVRHLIETGTLGEIMRYESRFERYRAEPRPGAWRELADPAEAGGLLFDLGSHLIDQAMFLFGKPTHVYAEVAIRRPGAQVDDDTFVALRFSSGVNAHLWMSAVAHITAQRVRITGLRGSYEKWGLDPQEDALRTGERPGDEIWGEEGHEHWGRLVTDVDNAHTDIVMKTLPGNYPAYYMLIRDALLSGGKPPVDAAGVVDVLRVIEAARVSAQSGQTVKLSL